jgi:predicted nucleic acid-binding protein
VILIDTGYLIALMNPRDQLHARAVAWSSAIHEPLLVTEYVLCECVNFFSMPPDRPKAHAVVTALQDDPGCEIVEASQALFHDGLRLHEERSDKSWSLTDCVSFVIMQQRGLFRALAYDKHFEEAGFEPVLRSKPPSAS